MTEEETFVVNAKLMSDFLKMKPKVVESELYKKGSINRLIIAHGLVAGAVKEAINTHGDKKSFGMFRPITLNPFPDIALIKSLKGIKEIIVVESAHNQLFKLVKEALYGAHIPIKHYGRPGLGITPEEIIKLIK